MSLSDPRILYGIHSISPYNRTTGLPYGILRVVGQASIALSASLEQLYGGSNKYPWAAESKTISTEISAKVKAYPDFLFQLFLGAQVTVNAADSVGTIVGPTDFGAYTSVVDPVTGIASIAVIPSTGKANLKFGAYFIKAASANTVNIYAATNIDFSRGTVTDYVDDTLMIAGPITVTGTSGVVTIPALGIQLVGGSGTIAFVSGEVATFRVRPPTSASSDILVGGAADVIPAFGAIIMAQKRATGEIFEIEAYNCVGSGMPINLSENSFSDIDLKITCLYDSVKNGVFRMQAYKPA